MKTGKLIKRLTAAAVSAVMCLSAIIPSVSAANYTITTQTDGHGTAAVTSTNLSAGDSYTLTATPDTGYEFDHWEITDTNGGVSGVSTKTANIAMVIDVTGSMDEYIQSVQENLEKFIAELNAQGITANLRFVTYYDKKITSYPFSDGKIWSSDTTGAYDIFGQILKAGTHGSSEYACLAFNELLDASGKLDFPTANNNYIFLLTDEDCDEVSGSSATANDPAKWNLTKWTDFLVASNVKVTTVCDPSWSKTKQHYKTLSTKTDGLFIDIDTPDYYTLLLDFAKFINNTVISINETYTDNPCTATMPACDICAKAVFKAKATAAVTASSASTHKVTVVVSGSGIAYADKNTAAAGEKVSITTSSLGGSVLKGMSSNGVTISGGAFTMPSHDVTILVEFGEDYAATGLPHSYVYSYNDAGDKIAVNTNRKFVKGSSDVTVTVRLGEDYAGKKYTVYTGKNSSGGSKVESGKLNSRGQADITMPMKTNYHLIVED